MIYLDHAATTTLRPEARAALLAALDRPAGNPTGAHGRSRTVRTVLEDSREQIAGLLGVGPAAVYFTSGGTESDNWAIRAAAGRGRILYSAVEHAAVSAPAAALGGEAIPVDSAGVVDFNALESMLSDDVAIVSVMAANNETGVITPLDRVSAVVRRLAPGAIIHTDAVQSFTKVAIDVSETGVDAVSISGHKIGAPTGIGALVIRRGVRIDPVVTGGGQERGMRAGTPAAAQAAAFAAAATASAGCDWNRIGRLRDRLEHDIATSIPGLFVYGAQAARLPTHSYFDAGVSAELAVMAADMAGLAVSSGSSCSSGAATTSGVLAAMGFAGAAIRFSLGWDTTDADVDAGLEIFAGVVDAIAGAAA